MRTASVSVIQLSGGIFEDIATFTETPEGNKMAEEYFTKLLIEDGELDDETIAKAIEDGHYEGSMNYEVLLTHSSLTDD